MAPWPRSGPRSVFDRRKVDDHLAPFNHYQTHFVFVYKNVKLTFLSCNSTTRLFVTQRSRWLIGRYVSTRAKAFRVANVYWPSFSQTGQNNMIQNKQNVKYNNKNKSVAPALPPGKLGCLSSSAMVAARPGMLQLSFFSRHCRIISLPLKMNFCNVPESKYSFFFVYSLIWPLNLLTSLNSSICLYVCVWGLAVG